MPQAGLVSMLGVPREAIAAEPLRPSHRPNAGHEVSTFPLSQEHYSSIARHVISCITVVSLLKLACFATEIVRMVAPTRSDKTLHLYSHCTNRLR